MARPRTIDDYLATLDDDARRTLEAVRASIKQAAPKAEDMSGKVVAAEAQALAGFDTSKGTIRFPIGKPLPARVVTRLVRARLAEIA